MKRLVSMMVMVLAVVTASIMAVPVSASAEANHVGNKLPSTLSPTTVDVLVNEPSGAQLTKYARAALIESHGRFLKAAGATAYYDSVVVERGWLMAGLVLGDTTIAANHVDSLAAIVQRGITPGAERIWVTVGSVDGTEYQASLEQHLLNQWTLGATRAQAFAEAGGLDHFVASPYSVAHAEFNDAAFRGAYVIQVRLEHVPFKLASPPPPPPGQIVIAGEKTCNLAIAPMIGFAGLSSPVGYFNGPVGGLELELSLRTRKGDDLGNSDRWLRLFLFGAGGRTGESPYDDQFEIWGGGFRFPGRSHVGESSLTFDLGIEAVGVEKLAPGDTYVAQANGIGPMASLGLNTTGNGVIHLGIRARAAILRVNYDGIDNPSRDYSWEPCFQLMVTAPFNCTNKQERK